MNNSATNRLSHNAYFQLRILHHYLHTTDMASICEVWHKIAQMPGTPAAEEQMFAERFIEGIDDLSAFISQAHRGGQLLIVGDGGELLPYDVQTSGALSRTIPVFAGGDRADHA